MRRHVGRKEGLYQGATPKSLEDARTMFFRYKNVAIPIFVLPLKDTSWRHNWRMWIGKYTLGRMDVEISKRWSSQLWKSEDRPPLEKIWTNPESDRRYTYIKYTMKNLSGRITSLLNTIEYGSCWYSPEVLVEFLHEMGATEAYRDDGENGPIDAKKG